MSVNEQGMEKLEHMWTRTWWTFVILGIVSLFLGVFSLLYPQVTATIPVRMVGVLIGLDGLFKIVTALLDRRQNWINRALGGATEVLIGILVFYFSYNLTTAVFTIALYIIGGIFFVWGVFSIMRSLRGKFQLTKLLIGSVQLAIGLLMFALTNQIAVSLGWITAFFFCGIGLLLIFAGMRMRQVGRTIKTQMMGNVVEGVVVHDDGVNYYEGHQDQAVILIPNQTESDG